MDNASNKDEEPDMAAARAASAADSQPTPFASILEECAQAEKAFNDNKLDDIESMFENRLLECRHKMATVSGDGLELPGNHAEEAELPPADSDCSMPFFAVPAAVAEPEAAPEPMPGPAGAPDEVLPKKYDYKSICMPKLGRRYKITLIKLLHKMSRSIIEDDIKTKISRLQQESNDTADTRLLEQIEEFRKDIRELSAKSLQEIALPLTEDYDWSAVAKKHKFRHTSTEYRAIWQLYLHPSINKKKWTRTEHKTLYKIAKAKAHTPQNWDDIAKNLGTGRSGYQCYNYYRLNKKNVFPGKKITSKRNRASQKTNH